MKKYLFSLLLFSITLLGYSEVKVELSDSTITQTVANVSSEVNPTVVYFTEKLQEFAKALQVPAEHVYRVLVQKQVVNSWSNIAAILFSYILSLLIFVYTIRSYSETNKLWRLNHANDYDVKNNPLYKRYDLDDNWWIAGIIISIIIFAITLTVMLICAPDVIIGLYNPEYGAIKEIMSLF